MFPGRFLCRGELGDSLSSLRHGVLGKLSREGQPDRSLDLPGSQGLSLVDLPELS